MPFVEEQPQGDQLPQPRVAATVQAPDPFAQGPPTADTVSAAFRQANPVASLLDTVGRMPGNEPTPGYNPIDTLKGTPHEGDDLGIYAGSQNEGYTRALMGQKDREDDDRRTLAASGHAGTVATLAAGLLDPAFAIPIVGEAGAGPLIGAARLGAYGAGVGAASETALQASQVSRPWQESAGNIASSAIFMGVLGGASGMLSKAETATATKALDEMRPHVDANTGDVVPMPTRPAPPTPQAPADAASMRGGYQLTPEQATHFDRYITTPAKQRSFFSKIEGGQQEGKVLDALKAAGVDTGSTATTAAAARILTEGRATDPWDAFEMADREGAQSGEHLSEVIQPGSFPTRELGLYPAGAAPADARQLELKGALGVEKVGLSPNLRIYNSSSVEAKRAMRDVAEFGGQFKEDDQVAPFGSPLESQARVLKGQAMEQANGIIERNWFQHYGAEEKQGTASGFLMKEGLGAPTAGEKLGFGDFDRAVGTAMHNGDAHSIPEVQAAAQELRAKVYDPIKKSAQETLGQDGKPMLGQELDAPKGAQSFFPLIPVRNALTAKYNETRELFTNFLEREQADKAAAKERLQDLSARRDALGGRIGKFGEEGDPWIKEGFHADHAALGEKIEQEIENWKGNTTKEAVAAIRKRDLAAQTGSTAGTKPAADAVDSAVKRILASDRDLSRQELQSRAQQWVDRLIGSPDGRLPYDEARTAGFKGASDDARGSLKERRMPIDVNELISRGLIDTSATHGTAAMARTIIPDILLTKRFGDVGMTNTIRRIDEEYAGKITASTGEKGSTKLIKERDGVIRDLSAARDRLRGVYGWDPSPVSRQYGAMIRDMQNINALRALGTSVANRMTDVSNAVFRHGFMNVFADAWAPYFQSLVNPELKNMLRDQARDAAVGIDGLLGHMRQNIYDVNNSYAPGNKFSRGLAYAADKSMIANLHGPWTDWNKIMVFNVAQGELGRMSARVVAGTATKRDLATMAGMSISPEMAARIAGQYDKHAIEVSGRKFADAPNWTDHGAKMAFEAAMSREANATVLTAGIGDKPLFMDHNLGKLSLQFKSFTAAAHEKILLSSLQKRDMRTVEGVLASVAMGMTGTALYKVAAGQDISSDPRDWIKEGLDRSAMTGWFGDANNAISKVTAGQGDYNRLYGATGELTRRREQSLEGVLGGPTVDLAEKLTQAGSHAATTNQQGKTKFTAADLHSLRVALPLQNLWAFRRLLDQVEESGSNALGLKARPKQTVH